MQWIIVMQVIMYNDVLDYCDCIPIIIYIVEFSIKSFWLDKVCMFNNSMTSIIRTIVVTVLLEYFKYALFCDRCVFY